MTALSASRMTKSRGVGRKVKYLMAASTTCYQGGMVCLNSAGLAIPAAAASGNKAVVGVAVKDITSAGSGSYWVEVLEGEFNFAGDTLEQEDVGAIVYADDDQTIDETQASNAPVAGRLIEYVGASEGWVRIGPDTIVA